MNACQSTDRPSWDQDKLPRPSKQPPNTTPHCFTSELGNLTAPVTFDDLGTAWKLDSSPNSNHNPIIYSMRQQDLLILIFQDLYFNPYIPVLLV